VQWIYLLSQEQVLVQEHDWEEHDLHDLQEQD